MKRTIEIEKPPALMDRLQAARWLSISPRKLGELTASKRIRCIRIDRSLRYDIRDLESFADLCRST